MQPLPGVPTRGGRLLAAVALALLALVPAAHAHESYMDCFDNGDGTVTCQAGYVDGAPPNEGDRILIKDAGGKTVEQGHFDADGAYTFEPPGSDYSIVFRGEEMGHTLRVNARDVIR